MAYQMLRQTNVFEVWNARTGERVAGTVSVDLPEFGINSNELSGSGLMGATNVPSPANFTPQTLTLNLPRQSEHTDFLLEFGERVEIELRADVIGENLETRELENVSESWFVGGKTTTGNPGSLEGNAVADAVSTIEVDYIAKFLAGQEVLEWDYYNLKYVVNGKDMMARTRANIGL